MKFQIGLKMYIMDEGCDKKYWQSSYPSKYISISIFVQFELFSQFRGWLICNYPQNKLPSKLIASLGPKIIPNMLISVAIG